MFFALSSLQLFLYRDATDMRKGFDGLSGLVITAMQQNPMSGDAYLFINRRRDRMKILLWERTGFVLYYKLLERGTFELPPNASDRSAIELSWEQLIMLLEGIELKSVKRRPRFHSLPSCSSAA